MTRHLTNWAGNITFGARRLHRPSSLAALRQLVTSTEQIRPLGTGHSFNRLADSPGDLVSVAGLPPTIAVDAEHATVTVAAGIRYGELAVALHRAGFALHNLGSLPHISIAGACATGTHGSGQTNGNLATAVSAFELVTADGELVTVRRDTDPDQFPGMVVGLGAFGIVTSLTLDIVPAFAVQQHVYENLPMEQLAEHEAEILGAEYSVSLFTDWKADRFNQVWVKRRVDSPGAWRPPARWLGATLASGPRNPVPGMPAENCTEQLGVPGPWYERLPHFRLDFIPSSGDELQSEYFVPRDRVAEALAALHRVGERIAPVLQTCELRTIAADDLWLSPSYRRDCVAFHFTWFKDTAAVSPVLTAIEAQLAPLAARPHWGKVFNTTEEVINGLYERLPDFQRLQAHYDPTGKFRNELLDRYVPAPDDRLPASGR